MSVALRKGGFAWAWFDLVDPTGLGKTVRLVMRKPGGAQTNLLELSVVGEQLIYQSMGNIPVLGSGKEAEHDDRKEPA